MLVRLISHSIGLIDGLSNKLLELQKQKQQRSQKTRWLHTCSRRRKVVERTILLALIAHPTQPLQQLLLFAQKVYIELLRIYFKAVQQVLGRARQSERPRDDNSVQQQLCIMEYLRVVFNDAPEIVRLLGCFTSVEDFERSLVPFDEPLIRERGGFFKRLYPRFELTCELDDKLLGVLTRFQKEDLYSMIVQKVHDNVPTIKFVLSIVLKALEYHEEPQVIAHKIHKIWTDVYDLMLNMIYQWICSLHDQDVQSMFGNMLKKFAAFNEQLPQWMNQLRDELEIANAETRSNRDEESANIADNDDDDDDNDKQKTIVPSAKKYLRSNDDTGATRSIATTSQKKRKSMQADKSKSR